MNKLLLLLFLLPYFGISQNYIPTKDVYDFDVGDEFHYNYRGPRIIEKHVIISKSSTSSSFTYNVKRLKIESHRGSGGYPDYYTVIKDTIIKSYGFGDTIRDTLPYCNSLHPYIDTSCGYTFCNKLDSLWIDTTRHNRLSYSFFTQTNCFEPDQKEKIYVEGLGGIWDWEYSTSALPPYEYAIYLSYYKKIISGETNGIPIDFSVGINELTKLNFKIYPNPANEFIKIETNNLNFELEFKLTNSLGQILLSGENNTNIDVSSIPPGIYFLKITNENGDSGIKRIVISR